MDHLLKHTSVKSNLVTQTKNQSELCARIFCDWEVIFFLINLHVTEISLQSMTKAL